MYILQHYIACSLSLQRVSSYDAPGTSLGISAARFMIVPEKCFSRAEVYGAEHQSSLSLNLYSRSLSCVKLVNLGILIKHHSKVDGPKQSRQAVTRPHISFRHSLDTDLHDRISKTILARTAITNGWTLRGKNRRRY